MKGQIGLEQVNADDILEALIEISQTERPGVIRALPRSTLNKLAASSKGKTAAVTEFLARQGGNRLESWGVPPRRIVELADMVERPTIYPDRGGPG